MDYDGEGDALAFATKDFLPIPRIARSIPFGYKVDPEDEDILLPVPVELEALAKAKNHLQSFSLREVANWLTKVTGRQISHEGLRKRLANESKRKRKAIVLGKLANRAEAARAKAEKIIINRTGAYVEYVSDGDEHTRL